MPPPRSVGDIAAILDQEKPDTAKIATLTRQAEAQPGVGLSGVDLARFYASRAASAAPIGRIPQSIADLHQALAIIRPISDQQTELYLAYLNLLRSIESRAGNDAAASALSRQVIDLTEGKGQPSERTVEAYQTLITFTAQAGRLDDATAQAATLAQLVDRLSQLPTAPAYRAGYGWSLDRARGVIALIAGRLDEAESDFRRATPEGQAEAKAAVAINRVFAQGWASAASYSTRDLAFALQSEGRLGEAEIASRQALLNELDVQGRYAIETIDMITALSGILAAESRYADSAKLAQIAIETYGTLGVVPSSRSLNGARAILVSALVGERHIPEALTQIDRVMQGLADDPEYRHRILNANPAFVVAGLRGNRGQAVVDWAKSAMEEAQRVYGANDTRTAIQTGLYADALLASGNSGAARTNFAKAVPILLSNADDAVDQTGQARADRWRSTVLDAYLTLLAKDNRPDAVVEAFRVADAARGQTVQRAVAQAAARSAARDPALADLTRREQDAQRQIDALTTALANDYAQPSNERDDAALAKLRSDIDQLTASRQAMRAQIAQKFPAYGRLTHPEPATVAQAQAALRPGEALLAIYLTDDRTYLWAVPKSGTPVFAVSSLSRTDIDSAVKSLRASLDTEVTTLSDIPAFDTAIAYRLYAGLLDPVKAGWQGAKNLLVVANGALGELPFGLLVTQNVTLAPAATGALPFANYRTVPWLIRPSRGDRSALGHVARRPCARCSVAAGTRKPFIGFGDPWFSAAEAAQARAQQAAASLQPISTRGAPVHLRSAPKQGIDSAELAELPRLPDTAAEVREVATALKADPVKDVYLGAQANEQVVRTVDLADRRVVMFATHGLVPGDLDGLTEPALALTAPAVANVPGDGLLTVSKILGLRLNADWVVLSACNTASGGTAGADAVSGLGLAFFYAGSRALLVSNWPVETTSARALTTDLFKREAATPGITRAEALREAMLALIDGPGARDPATQQPAYSYAHPLFWAPFSLVGDGGAEILPVQVRRRCVASISVLLGVDRCTVHQRRHRTTGVSTAARQGTSRRCIVGRIGHVVLYRHGAADRAARL